MSKWYSVRGVKNVEVMIEVEDDYSQEDAEKDVMAEFELDDIADTIVVPDDRVESYKRRANDVIEL